MHWNAACKGPGRVRSVHARQSSSLRMQLRLSSQLHGGGENNLFIEFMHMRSSDRRHPSKIRASSAVSSWTSRKFETAILSCVLRQRWWCADRGGCGGKGNRGGTLSKAITTDTDMSRLCRELELEESAKEQLFLAQVLWHHKGGGGGADSVDCGGKGNSRGKTLPVDRTAWSSKLTCEQALQRVLEHQEKSKEQLFLALVLWQRWWCADRGGCGGKGDGGGKLLLKAVVELKSFDCVNKKFHYLSAQRIKSHRYWQDRNKAKEVCSLFKTFTLVSLHPPFYQKMFYKKNSAHFLVFCGEIFQIVFIETKPYSIFIIFSWLEFIRLSQKKILLPPSICGWSQIQATDQTEKRQEKILTSFYSPTKKNFKLCAEKKLYCLFKNVQNLFFGAKFFSPLLDWCLWPHIIHLFHLKMFYKKNFTLFLVFCGEIFQIVFIWTLHIEFQSILHDLKSFDYVKKQFYCLHRIVVGLTFKLLTRQMKDKKNANCLSLPKVNTSKLCAETKLSSVLAFPRTELVFYTKISSLLF